MMEDNVKSNVTEGSEVDKIKRNTPLWKRSLTNTLLILWILGAAATAAKTTIYAHALWLEKSNVPPTAVSPVIDEAAIEQCRELYEVLEATRRALRAYRNEHGFLPNLTETSFDFPARERFAQATRGGKVAISSFSSYKQAMHFVGVEGGLLLQNPDFRQVLKEVSASGIGVPMNIFRRFDGELYDGRYASVFILL